MNLCIAAVLVMLGFSSCKSSKKAQAEEALREQAENERQIQRELHERDSINEVIQLQKLKELKRQEEMRKVVYGPPPARYQPGVISPQE